MTSDSVKHKDKREKKKKNKKKKKSKSSHVEDTDVNHGGSGDEINLDEELHPIGYYVNDREEMINQMFSVIKPHKLRAMLPPILKEASIEDLKAYCLDELLGMSLKRINSVLEGREMDVSSESEDDTIEVLSDSRNESSSSFSSSENDMPNEEEEHPAAEELTVEEADPEERSGAGNNMDTLEIDITNEEMGELLNDMPPNQQNKCKRPANDVDLKPHGSEKHKKSKNNGNERNNMENNKEDGKNDSNETNPDNRAKSSSDENDANREEEEYREIMELELRARAIRALLKQQQLLVAQGEIQNNSDPPALVSQVENPVIPSQASNSEHAKEMNQPQASDSNDYHADSHLEINTSSNVTENPNETSALDTSISNPLPSSKSKSEGTKKNTEENPCVSSPLKITIKSEDLCDKETHSDNSNIEYIERGSKTTENEESNTKDREDGELSSSESIVEILNDHDQANSEVIVLDDIKSDLLESCKKQVTSKTSDKNEQPEKCVKEKIKKSEVVSESPNQRISSNIKNKTEESVTIEDSDSEIEICTKDDSSKSQNKNEETVNVSWVARWLQSKDVQKVVSTSKMCGKIRNRMKSAQKKKKAIPENNPPQKESMVIVGSVKEYNMLDKPKGNQNETCVESGEKSTDAKSDSSTK